MHSVSLQGTRSPLHTVHSPRGEALSPPKHTYTHPSSGTCMALIWGSGAPWWEMEWE